MNVIVVAEEENVSRPKENAEMPKCSGGCRLNDDVEESDDCKERDVFQLVLMYSTYPADDRIVENGFFQCTIFSMPNFIFWVGIDSSFQQRLTQKKYHAEHAEDIENGVEGKIRKYRIGQTQ